MRRSALGPTRVLQNLKTPPPVHGAEVFTEIQKDALEGHPLTDGEMLVQRRLHDLGAAPPLGAEAVQKIVQLYLGKPRVQHLLQKPPDNLK